MKRKSKIDCEVCDSSYNINYTLGSTKEEQPKYCCFCGSLLDYEEDEDEEEPITSYLD